MNLSEYLHLFSFVKSDVRVEVFGRLKNGDKGVSMTASTRDAFFSPSIFSNHTIGLYRFDREDSKHQKTPESGKAYKIKAPGMCCYQFTQRKGCRLSSQAMFKKLCTIDSKALFKSHHIMHGSSFDLCLFTLFPRR